MRRTPLTLFAALFLTALPAARPFPGEGGRTLGMVITQTVSTGPQGVTVFDADTDSVLGVVPLGIGLFDCEILPDLSYGVVTHVTGVGLNQLWLIDLGASPPAKASGTNPILLANACADVAVSPDGRFAVTATARMANASLSVIDLEARAHVSSFQAAPTETAVAIGRGGNVLVTSRLPNAVLLLRLDEDGNLSDTGRMLPLPMEPSNVHIAPGGRIGVAVGERGEVLSFSIGPMQPIDFLPQSPAGFSAAFNPLGTGTPTLYVRTGNSSVGWILRSFGFDYETGEMGDLRWIDERPSRSSFSLFYGADYLGVHPDRGKVYTTFNNGVDVFDAPTGELKKTLLESYEQVGAMSLRTSAGTPHRPVTPGPR